MEVEESLSNKENLSSTEELIAEKLLLSRRAHEDELSRHGIPIVRNNAHIGSFLYDSIFDLEAIKKRNISEGLKQTLQKPIAGLDGLQKPPKDKFVDKFRRLMTTEVPYDKAMFEGAQEEVEAMLERGPVRIWTTGDVLGIKNTGISEHEDLAGSWEQHKKIVKAGFNRLRRGSRNVDIDFLSSEEKFEDLNRKLPNDKSFTKSKTVIVIDDRVSNILNAKEHLGKLFPDKRVIMVWDRQSEQESFRSDDVNKLFEDYKGTPEDAIKEFSLIAVDSVGKIVSEVEKAGVSGRISWLVDFDDVIISDNKKALFQEENILKWLEEKNFNNWVSNLQANP